MRWGSTFLALKIQDLLFPVVFPWGLPRPIREITQAAEIREAAQRWVCVVSKGKLAGSVLAHISLVSWCNNEPCIKACNTI